MSEENIRKTTGKRSKRRKWSNKKKVIVSTISIFVVIIGILLLGYAYVRGKIYSNNGSSTSNTSEYEEVEGITNILLIGTDARTLDEQSRSDSMIIATLDNNNKKIKLTSLFRDTLVDIPGYGESKLNSAYALGGPGLLLDTINETYGIHIDKYVVINFWGFEAVIDQIDGIEVDVKDYQIDELNKYIGESTGGNDCPVTEPGLQVLNGKQALSYARIRYNTGDEFERTSRQQEVIMKIAEKLRKTKPSKYLGIMNKMLDYVKTNIEPLQALNMAYTIYKFPSLETEQLQIPVPELAEGRLYKDLGWVFLMDREQNAQILHDFIYEDKIPNADDYDYDSLAQILAQYAADENQYNTINGINPEDYSNIDEELPKVEEAPIQDNTNEGGQENTNQGSGNQGNINQGNTNQGNENNTGGNGQGNTNDNSQTVPGGGTNGGATNGDQGNTNGGSQGTPDNGTQGGNGQENGGVTETPDDGTVVPPENTEPNVPTNGNTGTEQGAEAEQPSQQVQGQQ